MNSGKHQVEKIVPMWHQQCIRLTANPYFLKRIQALCKLSSFQNRNCWFVGCLSWSKTLKLLSLLLDQLMFHPHCLLVEVNSSEPLHLWAAPHPWAAVLSTRLDSPKSCPELVTAGDASNGAVESWLNTNPWENHITSVLNYVDPVEVVNSGNRMYNLNRHP